jgi:hypothetical protein
VGYTKGAPNPKHHGQAMRSTIEAPWKLNGSKVRQAR